MKMRVGRGRACSCRLIVLAGLLACGLLAQSQSARGAPPGVSAAPAGAPPRLGQVRSNPKDALDYVYVPPGAFDMGCVAADTGCQEDEKPSHREELTQGFWMGRTEVTVEAFARFASQTGYRTTAESDGWSRAFDGRNLVQREGLTWRVPGFEQTPKHPAVHVSWYDAWTYCGWVGGRLPLEAEWEYAARGGRVGTKHLWGDAPAPLADGAPLASVADASLKRVHPNLKVISGYDDGYAFTAPAGTFPPNGFGLQDMTGNVAEWCQDWHDDKFYATSPAQDPKGSLAGTRRVLRGGSWLDDASNLRASYRVRDLPTYHDSLVGFRCVQDAAP
jgi:formylglycine-generating enzyme required for sulfatase activity